jgi:hypothetical protein
MRRGQNYFQLWHTFSQTVIRPYIDSIPNRVIADIATKGGVTRLLIVLCVLFTFFSDREDSTTCFYLSHFILFMREEEIDAIFKDC